MTEPGGGAASAEGTLLAFAAPAGGNVIVEREVWPALLPARPERFGRRNASFARGLPRPHLALNSSAGRQVSGVPGPFWSRSPRCHLQEP
jgi:hypothetical protein